MHMTTWLHKSSDALDETTLPELITFKKPAHGSMRMITWLHKSLDVLDESTLQLIDIPELIVWFLKSRYAHL